MNRRISLSYILNYSQLSVHRKYVMVSCKKLHAARLFRFTLGTRSPSSTHAVKRDGIYSQKYTGMTLDCSYKPSYLGVRNKSWCCSLLRRGIYFVVCIVRIYPNASAPDFAQSPPWMRIYSLSKHIKKHLLEKEQKTTVQ